MVGLLAGLAKDGQLGNNKTAPDANPLPILVAGSGRISVISAGWSHTCAIGQLAV